MPFMQPGAGYFCRDFYQFCLAVVTGFPFYGMVFLYIGGKAAGPAAF